MSRRSVPEALSLIRRRLLNSSSVSSGKTAVASVRPQIEPSTEQLQRERKIAAPPATAEDESVRNSATSPAPNISSKLLRLRSSLSQGSVVVKEVQFDEQTIEFAQRLAQCIRNYPLTDALNACAAESVTRGCLALLPQHLWCRSVPPQHIQEESVGIVGRNNRGRRLRASRHHASDFLLAEVTSSDGVCALCSSQQLTQPPNYSTARFAFLLFKEDLSLSDALSLVAKAADLDMGTFTAASPPLDPAACTTQLCTVASAGASVAERLLKVNEESKMSKHRVRIQPLGFCEQEDNSTMHGVQFAAVLRSVSENKLTMLTTARASLLHGFINFFGVKKFGFQSFKTFHICECLQRGHFRNAMMMMAQNKFEADRRLQADYQQYVQRDYERSVLAPSLSEHKWIGELLALLQKRTTREADYEELYRCTTPPSLQESIRVASAAAEWNLAASICNYRRRRSSNRYNTVDGLLWAEFEARRLGLSAVEIKWELDPQMDVARVPLAAETQLRPVAVELLNGAKPTEILIPFGASPPGRHIPLSADAVLAKKSLRFRGSAAVPLGYRPLCIVPERTAVVVLPELGRAAHSVKLADDALLMTTRQRSVEPIGCGYQLAERLPAALLVEDRRYSTSRGGSRALALQGCIPSASYLSSLIREFALMRVTTPRGADTATVRSEKSADSGGVGGHSVEEKEVGRKKKEHDESRGFLGMEPSTVQCYD